MTASLSILLALTLLNGDSEVESPVLQENVLEVHELNAVRPHFDEENRWNQSLGLSGSDPAGRLPRVTGSGMHTGAAIDVMVDIVNQVIGDDLRYEGRDVSLESGSSLVVLAPEAVQARVRQTLASLGAMLSSDVELTVDVLTLEGALGRDVLPANTMPAADAERTITTLIGRGAAHESYRIHLGAGRTSVLDRMRTVPYVFDYDVEIAQGALVFDPIMTLAESGTRILMRGVPMSEGISLSLVYQSASLIDVVKERQLSLGGLAGKEERGLQRIQGPQVVQDADVMLRSVAFDTYLANGQAAAVTAVLDLGGKKSTQVVLLRSTGTMLPAYVVQRMDNSRRSVVLVNTELLNPPSLGFGKGPWEDHDTFGYHPQVVAELTAAPSVFLFDWIKGHFSLWRRLGPWAIAVTDPEWDGDAVKQLEQLLEGRKQSRAVLGLGVALEAVGGSNRVPVSWSLPVLAGSRCGVMVGIQTSAITDYDVEVAQFAAVGDPVRSPLLNGMAASVMVGSGELDVRAVSTLVEGPITTIDLEDPYSLGPVDQVRMQRLEIKERLHIEGAGSSATFGDSATGAKEGSLRMTVGVH